MRPLIVLMSYIPSMTWYFLLFIVKQNQERKKKKTSPFLTYRYNFPSHKKIIKILIISGK